MALDIRGLKRVFRYNGKELKDPNKSMSPEDVLQFYSGSYPELTTSNVHGPRVEKDKAVYEFKTTVGTKG